MSGPYTVTFINNSGRAGSVCLFQEQPTQEVQAVVWLSEYAYPTTQVTFTWSLDYDFVWSETGPLTPGITTNEGQIWPANLQSTNQVTLTYNQAFTFANQTQGPNSGSLYINLDATIPMNTASVGIGMAGAATFLVQAAPNLNLIFTPHPRYWIAFGTLNKGTVIGTGSINNPAEIDFPPNVFSMTATLNADDTWTVAQTE